MRIEHLTLRVKWCLPAALVAVVAGCGSAITLGVDPTEPVPVESLPAPQLSEQEYKKVLLLPPDEPVGIRDLEFDAPREKKAAYYIGKIEKILLGHGFEVVSSGVGAGSPKGSPAERAMKLGRETKADAVLVLQSVHVRGLARYFDADETQTMEVEESRVRADEDGEYYEAESGDCLHRIPYYEIRVEAKLLDARTGTLLWVGSGRGTSIDVIHDRWVAEVDDDCELLDENFIYADYQADEATFDNTATSLLKRLLAPMAKGALSGVPIAHDAPAPPPPAPPPPEPELKTKTALVSAAVASLREGPERNSKRRMNVPRKTRVEILETMGEWMKVKVQDGTVGWMHESTLIVPD